MVTFFINESSLTLDGEAFEDNIQKPQSRMANMNMSGEAAPESMEVEEVQKSKINIFFKN